MSSGRHDPPEQNQVSSRGSARARWGAVALLVLASAGWLVAISDRAGAPFGDSDEGINGAVWSYNAHSLTELGPVESRLGGVRTDGSVYATHPPGIVTLTATAQSLAGEGPWQDRTAAWAATLVAVALAYRLLRDLDVEPIPAAAATVAAFGCHMVLVYGYMLDTPVTSLPLGLAVLVGFNRRWQGRPLPVAAEAAIAAGAALAGWQASLTAGLAGASLAVVSPRGRESLRRSAGWLGGTAAGLLASFGWALWAYGSLDELIDKYSLRTGGTTTGADGAVGVNDVVSFQVPWLAQLLGLGILGVVLAAVAARDRTWRPPALLALVSVLGYGLLFREAAAGHQYWLYWAVIAVVIGYGYVAGPGLRRADRDLSLGVGGRAAAAVVLMAVVLAVNVTRTNDAGELIDRGRMAADLVIDAGAAMEDQPFLAHVGQPERPDAWVLRETGQQTRTLASARELTELAEEDPGQLVLVLGGCSSANAQLCEELGLRRLGDSGEPDEPRLLTAAELAAELNGEDAVSGSNGGG